MSNNELNLLVSQMGQALMEKFKIFRNKLIIAYALIIILLIGFSFSIYYIHIQMNMLRDEFNQEIQSLKSINAPQKIDHYFIINDDKIKQINQ